MKVRRHGSVALASGGGWGGEGGRVGAKVIKKEGREKAGKGPEGGWKWAAEKEEEKE